MKNSTSFICLSLFLLISCDFHIESTKNDLTIELTSQGTVQMDHEIYNVDDFFDELKKLDISDNTNVVINVHPETEMGDVIRLQKLISMHKPKSIKLTS